MSRRVLLTAATVVAVALIAALVIGQRLGTGTGTTKNLVFVTDLTVSDEAVLSWAAVPGTDHYVVVGADEPLTVGWTWTGTQTTVPYGQETNRPTPLSGTYRWSVMAYAPEELLAVSPSMAFRCDSDGCHMLAWPAVTKTPAGQTSPPPPVISRTNTSKPGP